MQDDKEQLEKSATRSIFFITLLVFPAVAGIVVLFPVIMNLIPKYHQWIPAILPLTLLAVNVSFAAVTTQLTNLLNAIGKIKITSALMVMWTVLTWVFVPFLAVRYGASGAAVGYAVVGASSVVAIFIVKKYVNFSLIESTIKPLVAAAVMAVVLIILRAVLPLRFYSVAVLGIAGIAVYFASIFILIGPSIITDVKKSFSTLFARK
jgi:O-antigen/teichoic acid export membrane protein